MCGEMRILFGPVAFAGIKPGINPFITGGGGGGAAILFGTSAVAVTSTGFGPTPEFGPDGAEANPLGI